MSDSKSQSHRIKTALKVAGCFRTEIEKLINPRMSIDVLNTKSDQEDGNATVISVRRHRWGEKPIEKGLALSAKTYASPQKLCIEDTTCSGETQYETVIMGFPTYIGRKHTHLTRQYRVTGGVK